MNYKFFISLVAFVLNSLLLYAQSNKILVKIDAIEKSNEHTQNINELISLLSSSKLNDIEKIAAQTALVHKYQELHLWDTCLNYCQREVALAHQQKNFFAEATFYKLIGGTYYYIPQKENAIAYWKKCIAIAEPNNYHVLLAQCYHNVGVISLEAADLNSAEKFFIKAIDLSKKNNDTASSTYSLHYRLLATTYETENKLDKAEKIFQDLIIKSRVAKDSANLVESLLFYTKVLKKKKEFDKAILLSHEALAIARKINLIDGEITALDTHSSNLAIAQNYEEAYKYKNEEDELLKTRFKGDLNNKISEAEAKFKNAEIQYENELAILKSKKEKQLYLLGLIGLLVVTSLILYNYFQKRNIKQSIQMQLQVQQEKERLSRDLHDNLGSQMALLSNNIEKLDTNYKKQNTIEENIETVKGTSKQILQTLRETIWILNKEEITAQDFFDKLIDYAHRYLQSYKNLQLKIEEDFTTNKTLNSNEALQLFRICQEAINNACKYSGATQIEIKGNAINNKFTIQISDEGRGFDANKINSNDHYGLKNMQQRAASINASIAIVAALQKGTSITISL